MCWESCIPFPRTCPLAPGARLRGSCGNGFPVSVSRRLYRGCGKGNGCFGLGEAVAVWTMYDAALSFEDGEGFTKGGGFHAAEFAQLPDGNGPLEPGHGLADAKRGIFAGRSFPGRGGCGVLIGFDRQSQSRAALAEFDGDIVAARGCAVLDREQEMGVVSAQVEIGVAPSV